MIRCRVGVFGKHSPSSSPGAPAIHGLAYGKTNSPPRSRGGDCILGSRMCMACGGTWLFSEPQLDLNTLIDLASLQWHALRASEEGPGGRLHLHPKPSSCRLAPPHILVPCRQLSPYRYEIRTCPFRGQRFSMR